MIYNFLGWQGTLDDEVKEIVSWEGPRHRRSQVPDPNPPLVPSLLTLLPVPISTAFGNCFNWHLILLSGYWFPLLLLQIVQFSSVPLSCLTRHARPPRSSPTPGVYPNSCPLSRWSHPTVSSSVVPFSSCLRSFPASGSFQWVSSSHQVPPVLEFQLQYSSCSFSTPHWFQVRNRVLEPSFLVLFPLAHQCPQSFETPATWLPHFLPLTAVVHSYPPFHSLKTLGLGPLSAFSSQILTISCIVCLMLRPLDILWL